MQKTHILKNKKSMRKFGLSVALGTSIYFVIFLYKNISDDNLQFTVLCLIGLIANIYTIIDILGFKK